MKRFIQSEAGAAVLWVLSALVLAAAISPWIYQSGKTLAAAAAAGDLNGFLEWLGAACGRAKFGRFFSRCLILSALLLLPFLLWRVRAARKPAVAEIVFLPRQRWTMAAFHALTGCAIAGGLLWGLGMVLESAGVHVEKTHTPALGKLVGKVLVPALIASVLEEWLFRGLLLGLWLRFAKPLAACVGTSLLFAFIHFLEPPDGSVIADPSSPGAGFELLGKISLHFADPRFFVTDFATLFAVGMILAMGRLRTGALWFSIGLHAGWIMAFKGFNLWYRAVEGHAWRPWGIGDSLRSGMLPLLTLGLTALVCHVVLLRFNRASR